MKKKHVGQCKSDWLPSEHKVDYNVKLFSLKLSVERGTNIW